MNRRRIRSNPYSGFSNLFLSRGVWQARARSEIPFCTLKSNNSLPDHGNGCGVTEHLSRLIRPSHSFRNGLFEMTKFWPAIDVIAIVDMPNRANGARKNLRERESRD